MNYEMKTKVVFHIGCFLSLLFLTGCPKYETTTSGGYYDENNASNLTGYQWHLDNTGQSAFASKSGSTGEDINQTTTYGKGITGNGVTVAVVDTGLEITHSDLNANIIVKGSWDFYHSDNNPTNTFDNDGDHGTSVAGLIAGEDNGIGGRGVAPDASLKGFSFIYSSQSVSNHVASLGGSSSNPDSDDVHIFNMSYGTSNTDDFTISSTLDDHLEWAVNNLRSGLGAIYVKSAGNGFKTYGSGSCTNANNNGLTCQNANMDANGAVPWIINVGAFNAEGVNASYSAGGSSIWISAPGGEYGYDETYGWSGSSEIFKPALITTDQSGCNKGFSKTSTTGANRLEDNSNGLNNGCNFTSVFNGTSSAAPIVSGAIALLLQANSNLTWRDVKHILAGSARQINSANTGVTIQINSTNYSANLGWVTNAAGYKFHNWYGFGALDVDAAIALAESYSTDLGTFTSVTNSETVTMNIPDNNATGDTRSLSVSAITTEIAEVTLSVTHADLGELSIELQSPSGTKSILMNIYNGFTGSSNLSNMVLISNAFYGESGGGAWTLRLVDGASGNSGTLDSWTIKIYGR